VTVPFLTEFKKASTHQNGKKAKAQTHQYQIFGAQKNPFWDLFRKKLRKKTQSEVSSANILRKLFTNFWKLCFMSNSLSYRLFIFKSNPGLYLLKCFYFNKLTFSVLIKNIKTFYLFLTFLHYSGSSPPPSIFLSKKRKI
jgi:hypothetical protein